MKVAALTWLVDKWPQEPLRSTLAQTLRFFTGGVVALCGGFGRLDTTRVCSFVGRLEDLEQQVTYQRKRLIMLTFITFKNAPEQLEILFDSNGAEELCRYLKHTVRDKDHLHLIIDNELDRYEIPPNREGEVLFAKHVRLEYWLPEDKPIVSSHPPLG